MAPHFYNTEEEIDHAMAMLDEVVEASTQAKGAGV